MIDKGVCDKGYAWNPSNCECECDKSCNFGEYLDYENCKCRKRLVDKLVEKCGENVDKAKLTEIVLAENENIYCVILDIFTINVGEISDYFIYFHRRLQQSTKLIK